MISRSGDSGDGTGGFDDAPHISPVISRARVAIGVTPWLLELRICGPASPT